MASSPLPPNATGADVARIVFAGCPTNPITRTGIGAGVAALAVESKVIGGVAGVLVGFGVTWLVMRRLYKKGRI